MTFLIGSRIKGGGRSTLLRWESFIINRVGGTAEVYYKIMGETSSYDTPHIESTIEGFLATVFNEDNDVCCYAEGCAISQQKLVLKLADYLPSERGLLSLYLL